MIHDHNIRKSQGTNEVVVLEEAIINLLKNKSISKKKFYQTAQ